jgi:Ca2+/Na+ antiporter
MEKKMKTYQFDPEKFKKQTKILVLMYAVPLLLMLILVFFLNRNRPEMLKQTIILVVLMIAFYGYMGFKRYKQNQQLWKEYSLTVDDDGVSQTQPNFPEVRIRKEEIKSIEVVKNGFYVQTYSQGRVLGISKELPDADYEELKQIFSNWAAENEKNRPVESDDEDDDEPALLDVAEGVEEKAENVAEDLKDGTIETLEELEDYISDSSEDK